jgi:hypothetical protein
MLEALEAKFQSRSRWKRAADRKREITLANTESTEMKGDCSGKDES